MQGATIMSHNRIVSKLQNELPEVSTYYGGNGPQVTFNEKKRSITHNHASYFDGRTTSNKIDEEFCHVKGCIAFFKTYAENDQVDLDLQAIARCAVKEDEARLEILSARREMK